MALTRGQLMDALRGLGVDSPEGATRDLTNEAIEGTVKKAQHKVRQGQRINGGLIVHWLRQGGDEGWGKAVDLPQEWFRTYKGRQAWIEEHVPDLAEDWAEVAVISLVSQSRTPTPELVRQFASLAEQGQKAHDELCKSGGERTEHEPTAGGVTESERGQNAKSEAEASVEAKGSLVGAGAGQSGHADHESD